MSKPELDLEAFRVSGVNPDSMQVESDGPRHVWYYKGNDLAEYIRAAQLVMHSSDKFYDVITGRAEGAHRVEFDGRLGLLLVGLVQIALETGKDTFNYPADFPKVDPDEARGFTTNYNYLYHFGLCERPSRGVYKLTKTAYAAYYGESIPDYVIVNGDKVLFTGSANTKLSDVNNIEDLKNNPYWWEAYVA